MRATTEGAVQSRELANDIGNDHDRSSPATVIISSVTKRARKPTNRYLPSSSSSKKTTPPTATTKTKMTPAKPKAKAPAAITAVKAATKKRRTATTSTKKKKTALIRGRTPKKTPKKTQQQQKQEAPSIQAADSELRAIVIGCSKFSQANGVKPPTAVMARRPKVTVAITIADYQYNDTQKKKIPKVSLSPVRQTTSSRGNESLEATPSSLPSPRMLHVTNQSFSKEKQPKRSVKKVPASKHKKTVISSSTTPKQKQMLSAKVPASAHQNDKDSNRAFKQIPKQKRPKKRESNSEQSLSVLECLPYPSSPPAVVPRPKETTKTKKRRLFLQTSSDGIEKMMDVTKDDNNNNGTNNNKQEGPPKKKARKSSSDKKVKRGSRGTTVGSQDTSETKNQQGTIVTRDNGTTLTNNHGIITIVRKSENNASSKKHTPRQTSLVTNVMTMEVDGRHPQKYLPATADADDTDNGYQSEKLLGADNFCNNWTKKYMQAPIDSNDNVVTDVMSIETPCQHPHLQYQRVVVRTMGNKIEHAREHVTDEATVNASKRTLRNKFAATRKSPDNNRVQRDNRRAIKAMVAAAAENIAAAKIDSDDEESVACEGHVEESDEDYNYTNDDDVDDDDLDEDIFDYTENKTTVTSTVNNSPRKNKGSVESNDVRPEAQAVPVDGGGKTKKKRKARSDKGVKRGSRKSKETGDDTANQDVPAPNGNQAESTKVPDTVAESTTTTRKPKRKPRADKGMKRGEFKKQKKLNTKNGGKLKTSAHSLPPAPKGYYDGVQCGNCLGCRVIQNCGKCIPCLDMPEFGGPGATNKRCILKKCHYRKARQSRAETAAEKTNNDKEAGKDKIQNNNKKSDPLQEEVPKIHHGFGIQDAHNTSDLESLCDYEDSVAGDISDMEMDANDNLDMVLPALRTAHRTYASIMGLKGDHFNPLSITTIGTENITPELYVTDTQEEKEATISPPSTHDDKPALSAADLARKMQEQQRAEMMQLHDEAGEDTVSEDDDDEFVDFFLPPPPLPTQEYY